MRIGFELPCTVCGKPVIFSSYDARRLEGRKPKNPTHMKCKAKSVNVPCIYCGKPVTYSAYKIKMRGGKPPERPYHRTCKDQKYKREPRQREMLPPTKNQKKEIDELLTQDQHDLKKLKRFVKLEQTIKKYAGRYENEPHNQLYKEYKILYDNLTEIKETVNAKCGLPISTTWPETFMNLSYKEKAKPEPEPKKETQLIRMTKSKVKILYSLRDFEAEFNIEIGAEIDTIERAINKRIISIVEEVSLKGAV